MLPKVSLSWCNGGGSAPTHGKFEAGRLDEMSVSTEKFMRLLNDANMQERVKLEDFMAVAAGARSMAALMVPPDLPDGDRIRENIDSGYSRRYYEGRRSGGLVGYFDRLRYAAMRALTSPLRYKASLLREAYEEAVWDHPNYRAHKKWADRLGLNLYEKQLRPSLDEVYLIREQSKVSELAALMVRRDEIRREMFESLRQGRAPQMMLVPEERSPEYLRAMGSLLDYPDCCIEAYVEDASSNVDSALRSSNQISDMDEDTPPTAFFAASFYPCEPDCKHAQRVGETITELFRDIDDRLADRMMRAYRANMDYVAKYPEIMEDRRRRMMAQYMGGGGNDRTQ